MMDRCMIPSFEGIVTHVLQSRPSTKWVLDPEMFLFTALSCNGLNEVNPLLYAAYASAQRLLEVGHDAKLVSRRPGSGYQVRVAWSPFSSIFH